RSLLERTQSHSLHLTAALLASIQLCVDCRLEIPHALKVRPSFVRCLHGESLLSLVGTKLLVITDALTAVTFVQDTAERAYAAILILVYADRSGHG
ncbi:hypothetical protein SARC_11433, partial [Sphaeroforma arctica JP610]